MPRFGCPSLSTLSRVIAEQIGVWVSRAHSSGHLCLLLGMSACVLIGLAGGPPALPCGFWVRTAFGSTPTPHPVLRGSVYFTPACGDHPRGPGMGLASGLHPAARAPKQRPPSTG